MVRCPEETTCQRCKAPIPKGSWAAYLCTHTMSDRRPPAGETHWYHLACVHPSVSVLGAKR